MSRGRQPNGRPSIYQGSDGRWYCWVTIGTRNGQPHRKKLSGKTAGVVAVAFDELAARLAQGAAPTAKIETVGEWLTHWLEHIIRPNRAYKTYTGYRSAITLHVIPRIGGWRLDGRKRLEPEHLEALYTALKDKRRPVGAHGKPLEDIYVHQIHAILRKAFGDAMRRGKAARNPAALIDPPRARAKKVEAHSVDETEKILKAALADPMGDRWIMGMILGPRQGETLGIRWTRVRLDPPAPTQPHVTVAEQLQRQSWQHGCEDPAACARPHCRTGDCPRLTCPTHRARKGCAKACRPRCSKHTRTCPPPCPGDCTSHARLCPKRWGGGLQEVDVKTAKGERDLPLFPQLVEMLRDRRVRQQRLFEELGLEWTSQAHVFTDDQGRPIDPKADHAAWEALLVTAGVDDSRLHAARHSAGTMMIATGTDIRIVQELLGHARVTTTEGYTDVAMAVKQQAVNRAVAAMMDGNLAALLQPDGATKPSG